MKNRNMTAFLMAAVLIAGSAFFAGCEKEETTETLTQAAPKSSEEPPEGWGLHRNWKQDLGKCVEDEDPHCFDDIVITPSKMELLIASLGGGTAAVNNFFISGDYKEYFPGFVGDSSVLQRLQNEDFAVTRTRKGKTTFFHLQDLNDDDVSYHFPVISE